MTLSHSGVGNGAVTSPNETALRSLGPTLVDRLRWPARRQTVVRTEDHDILFAGR